MQLYEHDLPRAFTDQKIVAIDTETLGLNIKRDKLCLVQIGFEDGHTYLVRRHDPTAPAPHLIALLTNAHQQKLFHYARFDMAVLRHNFGCSINNVYCTKIASKLCRTYTNRHGLADLVKELLGVSLDKSQQTTYWDAATLTEEQLKYAESDVKFLHALQQQLDERLTKVKRKKLATECFKFLETVTDLDLNDFAVENIFNHSTII